MGRTPDRAGLRDLVEGTGDTPALPKGRALDVGCGTGDCAIYLAQQGWQVTGVDYVAKPLEKARAKAGKADVSINFVRADVTQLSQSGIGTGFQLIVDNGCIHNMSGGDREAYVREVSAVAAPDARLFIAAFSRRPVRRAGDRSPRDRTTFHSRLDAVIQRRRAGTRRQEDPGVLLPVPTSRLSARPSPVLHFLADLNRVSRSRKPRAGEVHRDDAFGQE